MKKIPLTHGKFAIVDDEDYEWLNQYKWCAVKIRNTYYAMRAEKGEHIAMHREILGLVKGDGKQTDHRNHNGLDNWRCNMRVCTHSQNQHNQRKQNGTSKYKGVSWYKRDKKWRVCIQINERRICIGYFDNEIDAAKAYDTKAKELFGEFAYCNF